MATSMTDSQSDSETQTEDTNPTKDLPPSYSQQQTEIRRIVDTTELKEGDSWFLVEARWFKQWKRYVGFEAWDQHEAGLDAADPGPIDNKSLFKDDSSVDLKVGMIDQLDYYLLPSEAWEKLSTWYGVSDGQKAVERKVISQGLYVKHLKVEVYLTDVKLSLFTNQDKVEVKKFSKASKLENVVQEMKELFGVQDDCEVCLWSRYMSSSYEALDRMDMTLQDSSIYTGQGLVLEVRNEDGSWPRDKESQYMFRSSGSFSSSRSQPHTSMNSYTGFNNYSSASYDRTTKPGLTGLSNIGNTCFMNSALQCLSNTPPLSQYFLDNSYTREINRSNPLGMKGRIAEAYGTLLHEMWGGSYSVSPRMFKAEVGRFAPQFVGYQQHDSHELLAFLLDGLHEDLNRVKSKPYIELKDSDGRPDQIVAAEAWENHRKRNDSIIVDLIQGQYKSTVVCPTCNRCSVTFDPFMYLTLPLPVKKTRHMKVMLVRLDPMELPTSYSVTVPKIGTVSDLAKELSKQSGVDHGKMLFADVYTARLHKVFSYRESLQLITDRDEIFAYEVPVERSDDPDTVVLRVYLRERRTKTANSYYSGSYYYSSAHLFGYPFVVAVSREETTYKDLYRHLITRMRRFLRCPPSLTRRTVDNREVEESPAQQRRLLDIANDGEEGNEEGNEEGKENTDGDSQNEVEMTDLSVNNNDNNIRDEPCENCVVDKNHPRLTDSNEDTGDTSLGRDVHNLMESEDLQQESFSSGQQSVDKNRPNDVQDGSVLDGEHSPKLFTMSFVNSYGSSELKELEEDDPRPIRFRDHTYVALDWETEMKNDCIDFAALKEVKDDSVMCPATEKSPKKEIHLHDCIELFTKTETLSKEDPWYCSHCKDFKQAGKTMTLWRLPEVLIVHLKRFSYDRYWRDKLDTFVKFPVEGLDMSPYVVNQDKSCKTYDLCAISNHYGGLGGGHYTAYCKNKNTGKWHHFDDSSVTEMDGDGHDRLVSKAAYVLVYLRQDVSKNVMRQNSEYDDEMGEKDDEDEDEDEKSGTPRAEGEQGSESLEMAAVDGDKD